MVVYSIRNHYKLILIFIYDYMGSNTIIALALTVVVGVILAVLFLMGVITSTTVGVIIALVIVGMLVFHGGAVELTSGLSDHEGYERALEEEEERKREEEEIDNYHEDHHDDSHHEPIESHEEEQNEGF
jgi:hypothetical protein